MTEKCAKCKYFVSKTTNTLDPDLSTGECHKTAPKPGDVYPFWPRLPAGEWCGEFRAAAKK